MELIIQILFTLMLLFVGYVVGTILEKRHMANIKEREINLIDLQNVPSKFEVVVPNPNQRQNVEYASLVMGSCVISDDYFKTFIAKIKTFFGGYLTTYESLIDRARREATLRMKEEAKRLGADMIVNTRIETSSIGGGMAGQEKMVCSVEALAYGTAIKMKH